MFGFFILPLGQKNAENDLELIIKQIQNNNPRADERNKLQTAMGSWFYKLDENRICYLGWKIYLIIEYF